MIFSSLRSLRAAAPLILAASLAFIPAHAAVIDFEPGHATECYASACGDLQGFSYAFNADGWAIVIDHSNEYFNHNSSFGHLGARGSRTITTVVMTPTAGGEFSIYALDAATGNLGSEGSSSLLLTGALLAGGTVTQTLSISPSWSSFTLSGFTGLTQLTFSTTDLIRGFGIDNLSTSPITPAEVPEPATFALTASALAAAALLRTRAR